MECSSVYTDFEEEPYELIQRLMYIEKVYLNSERIQGLGSKLKIVNGYTLRKRGTKYDLQFTPYDRDKAITLIMLIMEEYNFSPQEIYNIIKDYSYLDYWRINNLLYHIDNIRDLHMKTIMRKYVPSIVQSIYRPPHEGDSQDKGGVMYQKSSLKYPEGEELQKSKNKPKKKSKKKSKKKKPLLH